MFTVQFPCLNDEDFKCHIDHAVTSELQSNEFFVLSTKLEHVHMGVRLVKIPFKSFFFFFF